MKLGKALQAHPYRREHYYWQDGMLTIMHNSRETTLSLRGSQDLPSCLIWKINVQDNQIKGGCAQIVQRCLGIRCQADFMMASLQVARYQVA
jgi:hypothetical protein